MKFWLVALMMTLGCDADSDREPESKPEDKPDATALCSAMFQSYCHGMEDCSDGNVAYSYLSCMRNIGGICVGARIVNDTSNHAECERQQYDFGCKQMEELHGGSASGSGDIAACTYVQF